MDRGALRQEIAELERRLALARGQVPRRPDRSRAGLSFMQSQLWFLEQLAPGRPTYHIAVARRVRGRLDVAALRRALGVVVARHEALRTTFGIEDGVPFQMIHAPGVVELAVEEAGTDFAAVAREEAARPFDFAREPLFRVRLLRLGADDHVLCLTMHHLCADGWSVGIVLRELAGIYAGVLRGTVPELPRLPVQPGDLAEWQLTRQVQGAIEEDLAYWDGQLRDAVPLDFPSDRPRPGLPSYRGDGLSRLMPLDVLEGARDVARRGGTTLFAVVVAALKAVLSRWTGLEDIVIGSADSGRFRPELEPMVGCLINMVALRTDLSGDPTFAELAGRVSTAIAEAMSHRGVPLEKIVERLHLPRDPSRNPLFQIAIDIQKEEAFGWELPGCVMEPVEAGLGTSRFDMAINTYETSVGLALRAEFATDLFDRSRVERLLGHVERVLRAVAGDPGLRVGELPLLGEEERLLVSQRWQGAVAEQPGEPVHVQVAARAAADPGAVAAVAGARSLSFGELDRLSGLVAGRLAALGVVAGDVVAVALERGCELLVALVGVLKAGAAFVVVDPEHPAARLAFIFADTRARVVVTDARTAGVLPAPAGWAVLEVDRQEDQIAAAVPVAGERVGPDAAAYVLYTSGSTGNPKGVVVEHHALTTFTMWLSGVFGLGPGTRMAHHMALIFDFAIGEIFTALTSGATLVFVAERDRLSPEAIGDLLEREHVTYLGGPPAMLAAIPQRPYPDLRYLVAGGEAFPGDLVNRWNTPGRRFINGYGPTEAAVGCIFYECEHREWVTTPPIGRPMPRRFAYVLDRGDNLCPVGVPGEIVVGGAGLARGYLNLPELTAQRFTPDPVRPGGRIYRTGDLGMWTQDGQIQFLGRIDSQVKVNGLRIELEEIESVLAAHPGVAAAAVTVHGDGAARRLAGYVVPAAPGPEPGPEPGLDPAGLAAWLASRLPRYMIPVSFTIMDRLPLTRAGKTDRAALPAPDLAPAAYQPPATPTEQQVAAIFTAVLGIDHISRDDNFFTLGGTSIQAAQAVLRLRADLDVELALGGFYTAPQVADIARAVEDARTLSATQDDQAAEIAELERRLALAREQLPDGPLPPRPARRHAEILLTGATGFFGAFLLEELLTRTSGTVHCLVRAATDDEARWRLRDNLGRYGREHVGLDPRVAVIPGDLARPRLGLAAAGYTALASRIDTIVHAGAHVDLLVPYSGLERANVGGTRSVIDLATACSLKEVHFISSVSAALGAGLDPASFGYPVSKWRAELIAQAARDGGVPIWIYRLPRLSGDSRTGVSNDNDVVMRLMRLFQQMGMAPDLAMTEDWIPVNIAARTLVDTALSHPEGGLFTLQPRGRVEIRRILELAAETAPLVVKPAGQFLTEAGELFPDVAELIGAIIGKAGPGAVIDESGIGPFETVPADGVSDDLLRRYLRMWLPEADDPS